MRQEKGEGMGTFTRRASSIFFRQFPGREGRFLGVAGFMSDHNIKDEYERTS